MEQPLVFPGNDLVGVMLPEAARRLVNLWSVAPGGRAFVVTADDRGLAAAADLTAAGVEVAGVLRSSRGAAGERPGARPARPRRVARRRRPRHRACDLVVMSGSPQPDVKLLAQAGARVSYDRARGVFVPTEFPPGVEAVGAASGDVGAPAVPPAVLGHGGERCLVCLCEDQTTKDLAYAIDEGFDSIELAKRYTTVTMVPCQERLCQLSSVHVHATTTGLDEAAIGTTTARPPHTPVTLGLLAGQPAEPVRRTALHHRHDELGPRRCGQGPWKRPHSYRSTTRPPRRDTCGTRSA